MTETAWVPTTRRDAVREPLGPGFSRHTWLLSGLLGLSTAVAALGCLLGLWAATAATDREGTLSPATLEALQRTQLVNLGQAVVAAALLVLTAGAWLTWERRLATSTRIHPTLRRRDPQAYALVWLVPGPSLVRPLLDTRDLWRGVHAGVEPDGHGRPLPPGQPDPPVAPLLLAWWAAWLVAGALWWIAGPLTAALTTWDDTPGYWVTRSLGQGFLVVAGVAAWLVIRRLDPFGRGAPGPAWYAAATASAGRPALPGPAAVEPDPSQLYSPPALTDPPPSPSYPPPTPAPSVSARLQPASWW